MSVTMEIREEGHVAYYVLSEPWKTQDLTALYAQDIAHRDTTIFLVHTFMDVSRIKQIPIDIIGARRGAPAFIHPKSGQLVMTGANTFARRTAEMIFRLAHYERAKFFKTEEEGWAYIRQNIGAERQALLLKHNLIA
jgi:hypothetical protein